MSLVTKLGGLGAYTISRVRICTYKLDFNFLIFSLCPIPLEFLGISLYGTFACIVNWFGGSYQYKDNNMLENGRNDESVILIHIYLAHDLKFHSEDPIFFWETLYITIVNNYVLKIARQLLVATVDDLVMLCRTEPNRLGTSATLRARCSYFGTELQTLLQ